MTDHRQGDDTAASGAGRALQRDVLATLFDLARQVTSVLDIDELLKRIPELIARLIDFEAFAVYLLDARRAELRLTYGVGYPESSTGFG